MPRHADEQSTVMSEVRRPPVLRVGHQGVQILDYGIQVEALELLGVVEILAHRIGQTGVSMELLDIQRVRPPFAVRASVATARERALAFARHVLASSDSSGTAKIEARARGGI